MGVKRCRPDLCPVSERAVTSRVRRMEETRRTHRRVAQRAAQHRIGLSSDYGEVREQPVRHLEAKGRSNHRRAEAGAVTTKTDLLRAACTMEMEAVVEVEAEAGHLWHPTLRGRTTILAMVEAAAAVVVVAVVGEQDCLLAQDAKVSPVVLV